MPDARGNRGVGTDRARQKPADGEWVEAATGAAKRQKTHDKLAAGGKKKRNLKLAHGPARPTDGNAGAGGQAASTALAAAAASRSAGTGAANAGAGVRESRSDAEGLAAHNEDGGGDGGDAKRVAGGGCKMVKRTVTAFFRQPATGSTLEDGQLHDSRTNSDDDADMLAHFGRLASGGDVPVSSGDGALKGCFHSAAARWGAQGCGEGARMQGDAAECDWIADDSARAWHRLLGISVAPGEQRVRELHGGRGQERRRGEGDEWWL